MSIPKTDALSVGYTPYNRSLERGGREKQGSKKKKKRVVQGLRDKASNQQGSPSRTATSSELEEKQTVSSLLYLLAMPYISKSSRQTS